MTQRRKAVQSDMILSSLRSARDSTETKTRCVACNCACISEAALFPHMSNSGTIARLTPDPVQQWPNFLVTFIVIIAAIIFMFTVFMVRLLRLLLA